MNDPMPPIRRAVTPDEIGRSQEGRRRRLSKLGLPPEDGLGEVFADEYIRVSRDPVLFPDGLAGTYLRIEERVSSNGVTGVVVVPGSARGLLLQRTYRYPTQSWEWEFPRGFLDAGKTPVEMARRELREETGFVALSAKSLGRVKPNTGMFATVAEVFWVEIAEQPGAHDREPGEVTMALQMFAPDEIWKMVADGQIEDGFTLSAITLAAARGLIPHAA
jgi:8-oxo-dGTP pyrophosphatase MutT (NUDIX family)